MKKKARLVSLDAIRLAFEWAGRTLTIGEVECILANLAFCKLIGGNIAHSHGKLVLAATKGVDFPIRKSWPVKVG